MKMNLTDLPLELLKKVLGNLSFGKIGKLRLVSKYFDQICSDLLNIEFNRQKAEVLQRYNYLKTQMPRRESSRRKHPLLREHTIIGTVHMRLTLLNLTLGKHVEKNHGCFFAGEILDEVKRLVRSFKNDLNPCYKITDELFELSSMAVGFFKDKIEPVLPQELCISEFLEKSIHSTAGINSCVLEEAHEIPMQESQEKSEDLALKELKRSLRITTRIVSKNRRDINSIKLSLKSLNQEITTLENMVNQIQQHQTEGKEISEHEKDKDISEGEKDNEEIAAPKDMNEMLKKLNQCNEMIDSFESQLYKCQQSEPEVNIKNCITGVDNKACAGTSGIKHCNKNSQNEKICCRSKSSIHSTAQDEDKNTKLVNVPCLVSTRNPLKRKSKIVPSKVLTKKKRS